MIRLTAIVAVAVVAVGPARAEPTKHVPPPLAVEHYKKGDAAYTSGNFKTAIEEFRAAYSIDPAPLLLYNIAQAMRLDGQLEGALFIYKQYLSKDPRGAKRGEAEGKIKELEDFLKRQQDTKNGPPVGTAELPEQNHEAIPTAVPTVVAKPPSAARPWWRNSAGWAIAGTGLALVAVGAGLVGSAVTAENDARTAAMLQDQRDLHRRANQLEPAGWVLFGIGGAGIVAGAAVLATRRGEVR